MAETSLSSPPLRRPLIDQGGRVQEHWARWFEQLWRRVGMANAPSISDLENSGLSLAEQLALVAQVVADLEAQGTLDTTIADVAALRARLAVLEGSAADPSPWAALSTIRRTTREQEVVLLFA